MTMAFVVFVCPECGWREAWNGEGDDGTNWVCDASHEPIAMERVVLDPRSAVRDDVKRYEDDLRDMADS